MNTFNKPPIIVRKVKNNNLPRFIVKPKEVKEERNFVDELSKRLDKELYKLDQQEQTLPIRNKLESTFGVYMQEFIPEQIFEVEMTQAFYNKIILTKSSLIE